MVGNIVTAWSWFGTNQLGVGLHAYGFQSGTAWGLAGYAVSQVVLIGVGLLPLRLWRSFAADALGGPPPPPQAAPNGRAAEARQERDRSHGQPGVRRRAARGSYRTYKTHRAHRAR